MNERYDFDMAQNIAVSFNSTNDRDGGIPVIQSRRRLSKITSIKTIIIVDDSSIVHRTKSMVISW